MTFSAISPKTLLEQLVVALERDDTVKVQNLVDQIDDIPHYILGSAVGRLRVDLVKILAPKCSLHALYMGLNRSIMAPFVPPPVRLQLVTALLPHTNQIQRDQALADACCMSNDVLVDLLYPLCDAQEVLKLLRHHKGPGVELRKEALRERINSEKLRATLNEHITTPAQTVQRKM